MSAAVGQCTNSRVSDVRWLSMGYCEWKSGLRHVMWRVYWLGAAGTLNARMCTCAMAAL